MVSVLAVCGVCWSPSLEIVLTHTDGPKRPLIPMSPLLGGRKLVLGTRAQARKQENLGGRRGRHDPACGQVLNGGFSVTPESGTGQLQLMPEDHACGWGCRLAAGGPPGAFC